MPRFAEQHVAAMLIRSRGVPLQRDAIECGSLFQLVYRQMLTPQILKAIAVIFQALKQHQRFRRT